jgi:ankyrin repeat protein
LAIQLRDSGPVVSDEVISGVEGRLAIELPGDYRSFLLGHNGGVPRPEWFRLKVKENWVNERRTPGRLRTLGQKYGNETLRENWREWHRVDRFLGIHPSGDSDSHALDLEQAFRQRPSGIPEELLAVAEVSSFHVNGWLCVDVSREDPARGRVVFWPDVAPGSEGISAAPVASSFRAMLEILRSLGDAPPEWQTLVQDGDLDGFRRWIGKNMARLRDQDAWGWTSLDHAVFEEQWEIAEFLMAKRDVTPSMVFYDAMVDGRFQTARGMLRFGVEEEFTKPALARKAKEFWTDLDMVSAFLDAGADVDHIDDDASHGNSPLHYAAAAGELAAVRLLLARGADPTVENGEGKRPQDLASAAKYDDIAEELVHAAAARPARASHADEIEEVDLHSVKIIDSSGGLDEQTIGALESRLQVRLPGEYRAFLKRFNGGRPRPARFRVRDEGGDDDRGAVCEVSRFLSVGLDAKLGEDTDLEATRKELSDWGLPTRMLPIASVEDEVSGGLLCISVRGKDRGRVFYYPRGDSTDSTTYRVAKTLSRFFALLSKSKDKTPDWVQAIEAEDLEALQGWLDAGGSLKKRHRGRTPLETAVDKGRTEVVRWFIKRGVKPKAAFEAAMQAGQAEIMLDLLHDEEVKKSVPRDILGLFLHVSGPWRNLELVRTLLDLGADPNASKGSGMTPLMIAAQLATANVVRLLLARGARTGVWSQQGELALHRAACSRPRSEMLEKMKILIDAGESLRAFAPHSALPDQVLKTTQAMQQPIGDILKQAGPQASLLRGLLESLAQDPGNLPMNFPATPAPNPYFAQFQRTAADLLLELHKDPDAVAELEGYESSRRNL